MTKIEFNEDSPYNIEEKDTADNARYAHAIAEYIVTTCSITGADKISDVYIKQFTKIFKALEEIN